MKKGRLFNEKELLVQVARGNEEAFTTLFHYYKDMIYSTSLKLTKSSFLAEEVVQEVFLKLWVRRAKLTEVLDFEHYIFVMARNTVFSAMKSTLVTQDLAEDTFTDRTVSYDNADSLILCNEYELIIQQAVDRLPRQQKEIYLLSKEKEMKREEIAESLHLSSETVKTHLSRALRSIRAYSMTRLSAFIFWVILFLIN